MRTLPEKQTDAIQALLLAIEPGEVRFFPDLLGRRWAVEWSGTQQGYSRALEAGDGQAFERRIKDEAKTLRPGERRRITVGRRTVILIGPDL
jgi:hypothetical protein